MKIVIIGSGKVGYKLARDLSHENYDVVLVDQDENKLKQAINRLDINCAAGEGGSVDVMRQAGVDSADLVIVCTSTDETNMMICLVARQMGAKQTIARVRNPIYYSQIDLLKKDLRLSMAVNPDIAMSEEITRILLAPSASKVEIFAGGRVEMMELAIAQEGKLTGISLAEIYSKHRLKVLVCAIERGDQILIPGGDAVIMKGDRIHVVASHRAMIKFLRILGQSRIKIRKVMICGGGRLCYYLAERLLSLGMQIRIIEKNQTRCEELSDLLPKAMIIHGDSSDQDLLVEEGLHETDAFIALAATDEENIISSLFAIEQGVPKVIAKVNEDHRARMAEDLGIDSLISAKNTTADVIMGYVRAIRNSMGNNNVASVYQLVDGKLEAVEFMIRGESEYTGKPIKELSILPNHLIACIARGREIIIPRGDDCITAGDSVVVVTMDKKVHDIGDIFEKK